MPSALGAHARGTTDKGIWRRHCSGKRDQVMSTEFDRIAAKIERLASSARLADLALFIKEGESSRVRKIRTVLARLEPGVYLIGAGPYAQGVHSLMCDEVVIGRMATVIEKTLDRPVDVFVDDETALVPREVSRVHCAIYRREGVTKHDYWIIDRGSTCGTYVNQERVPADRKSTRL